jgi:hypothetical protein
LAYEIALAKRQPTLRRSAIKALEHYEAVLHFYLAANEMWRVGREFRECEVSQIRFFRTLEQAAANCFSTHGDEVRKVAVAAQVSIDDVEHKRPDAVFNHAAQEIDQAERVRSGK